MRTWLIIGALAVAAGGCNDRDNSGGENSDSDNHDDDNPQFETATCDDLYDRGNHCLGESGCPNAFDRDEFVDGCQGQHFSPSTLGDIVSETCDSINIELCSSNASLFTLDCCRGYFTCPSDLNCEPLSEDTGVCVDGSTFPPGAETCDSTADCQDAGYICLQGDVSRKCVQLCVLEPAN